MGFSKRGKYYKPTKEDLKLKETANDLFLKGKFKKALPAYLKLSQIFPKDLRIKTRVGDLLFKLGQLREAAEVYRSVAAGYAAEGRLIQAIAVNKLILKINPHDQGIIAELVQLYGRRKESSNPLSVGKTPQVVRPIQIRPVTTEQQEVILEPLEDDEPLEISAIIPLEDQDVPEGGEVETADELIDFSDAVDMSAIADLSLPPTPLFSDLDQDVFEMVLNRLKHRDLHPGVEVCGEGDPGDSIFIISEGNLQVSCRDERGEVVKIGTLHEGDFFGEFGYFSDRKRHASVRTITHSVLLELGRRDIDEVVKKFPRVLKVLQDFYMKRLLDMLLAKSRIFRPLSPEQRQILIQYFIFEEHPQGHRLMREGEEGDAMYLIQSGEMEVLTGVEGKQVRLAVLKEGNFCGEFSVLTDAKRTANVVTLTPVKLLKLPKRDARELVSRHEGVRKVLKQIADERVKDTIRTLTTVSTTIEEADSLHRGLV